MRTLAAIVGLALAGLSVPSVARADHAHPLQDVTCVYRDAVNRLEEYVDRSRSVSAYADQYVHRLADAACALHDAAAHPDDLYCIRDAFAEAAALHARVEQLLVTHCQHPDPNIVAQWRGIAFALDRTCSTIDYMLATTAPVPPSVTHHVPRVALPTTPPGSYPSSSLRGKGYGDLRSDHRFSRDRYGRGSVRFEPHAGLRTPGPSVHVTDDHPHDPHHDPYGSGYRAVSGRGSDLRARLIGSLMTHLLD